MPLSAFDIIGPVMVGPSSSHTAGAARLGLLARALLGEKPLRAGIGLHGSFAATGRGHATDRALVAGLLGLPPDDADLPRAPELAASRGLAFFSITRIDLGDQAHPNTASLTIEGAENRIEFVGSSLGGGIVEAATLDGHATAFRGDQHTLVFWHEDRGGFLSRVTALLACAELNIATLRTSRSGRGHEALTVVEIDGPAPDDALGLLARLAGVRRLRALAPLP